MDISRDLGDIRVLETGMAASYREYPDDGEGARRRKDDTRAESDRLIHAAKAAGLFIQPDEIWGFGDKISLQTRESLVFVDEKNERVIKVKDPYALTNLKKHSPLEAIYEHIVHNLYFPETRYSFMGITTHGGDVRVVLSQPFVRSVRTVSEKESLERLRDYGIKPSTVYFTEDEFVKVTDYWGSNTLVDEKGRVRYIDPVFEHKVPAKLMLNHFLGESLSQEQMQSEKSLLLFYMERDSDLSVDEALRFRFSQAREQISDEALLAFQMRHTDKLIFRDRNELGRVASKVLGRSVRAEEVLSRFRLDKEFERVTGKTINQAIMYECNHIEKARLMDKLDAFLRNIHKMDVLDIERTSIELDKVLVEVRKQRELSPVEKAQIQALREHLLKARKELVQWVRRGYRLDNTAIDKMLKKEFHPTYKLPQKELMKSKEGREYYRGVKKIVEKSAIQEAREKASFELARAKLLLMKNAEFRKVMELSRKESEEGLSKMISETQVLARNKEAINGDPIEKGWMRLSELKLDNIQEGEVRLVPGMSKSLIKCAEQMADVLTDEDNPQSINPPGKNPIQDARRERLKSNHSASETRTMKKWIDGYGASKSSSRKLKKD